MVLNCVSYTSNSLEAVTASRMPLTKKPIALLAAIAPKLPANDAKAPSSFLTFLAPSLPSLSVELIIDHRAFNACFSSTVICTFTSFAAMSSLMPTKFFFAFFVVLLY